MGDTFERAQRYRREHAGEIDSGKRQMNVATAILLGILALGILAVAVWQLSPVGIIGALVALAAPWSWMRADRVRVDEIAREHQRAYAAEFGWTVLAIALLAGGYALFITALVHGW
jgi:hypothetical protein